MLHQLVREVEDLGQLGLAIVAAIVKNAGGTIELRNRPGVGLEVVMRLHAAMLATGPGQ